MATRRPAGDENHYPFAYSNAAQLFEDPRAPDIAVVRAPGHSIGGHRGEHGSLDVVQSRAPLIISGAGVRRLGLIQRAARMVDIAPTVARMRGIDGPRVVDGVPISDVLDGEASRVVVFLWDGTNANVLYEMASSGELPNVAQLMSTGTTFAHGCVASFPSVTLANHTTAVTGCHPGRHGVLNNFYFDRTSKTQIVANSPETWHEARDKIATSVETVFEAFRRAGLPTAAVNEPADRGAGYATFDVVRAAGGWAGVASAVPGSEEVANATSAFMGVREYAWSSAADDLAVRQVVEMSAGGATPSLLWVNLILPDAANHTGGPYSDMGFAALRDTDARMGAIIDAIGSADTAFLLLADHGMEEADPACDGSWDGALHGAGIPFRDEGYGFIYLGT